DFFLEKGFTSIPDDSVYAVTVPGAADAWCTLTSRYGSIGLDHVLAPAIAAAENGYCITPRVQLDWVPYGNRLDKYPPSPAYFLPNGRAPKTGENMTNPALAATLRKVAKDGRDAFYRGEVAAEIVETLQKLGGLHEESDFADYHCFETAPISAKYRGRDVLE